jgi:ATP-binding cassette, subfamily B, bacterial
VSQKNETTQEQSKAQQSKRELTRQRFAGLWRFMEGLRGTYIGATVSLGIGAVARTATFLVIGHFIDEYLAQGRIDNGILLFFAGLFLALAVGQGVFTFLSGRLAARTAEGVALKLRTLLYDHLQHLPFSYHDQAKTGELIQRATSDIDATRRFFSEQAIGIGRIALLFVINFIAIATFNWQLALFSVIAVPLVGVASVYFFRRIERSYEKFQEQESVVSTTLQENLSAVRVVKAFARQSYEIDKFETENWKKYQSGRKLIMNHAMYWPTSDVFVFAQTIAGWLVAATLVIDGTMTIGAYVTYVGLLGALLNPVRELGRLIIQLSSGLVSFDRVNEVLRQTLEPLDDGKIQPTGDVHGEIVFDHVTMEYEPGKPVLKDVSFTCKPGQTIALLGSTGSGKTTLVNLLPRFYNYTSGSITLDGVELRDYSKRYLRSQIGVVEQEPFLFSRTIRENIAYSVGREVTDEEVIEAARAAAIHDSIMSFPEKYNTLVGEKGVTLSGGQKQRTALARTLLKNPKILILDDATSSVDTETEAEIRAALERLMQNRTTFIIAHRIQSVMIADLILVIDKGEIVQRGTHDELMQQEGMYRQIYEMQSRIDEELERELASAY